MAYGSVSAVAACADSQEATLNSRNLMCEVLISPTTATITS